MYIYCGIDPGTTGAVAFVRADGYLLGAFPAPVDAVATVTMFRAWPTPAMTLIEQVHSSPQMGVVSAFTFGRAAERAEIGAALAGWRYSFVTPQHWQKMMECRTRGNKAVSKARAIELFPQARVTNKTADALLIAEYCRRSCAG